MLFLEWKNQKTLFLALNYIIMSPAKHPNTWGSPWWSVTPSFFSEDRSIDSFVPMTYLFFLSISRIWNWLGDQIFKQTLNVIKLISMPCIYFLFLNLINIRIGWRCCFRSFWEYFHSSEQSGGSSCQHLQCCRPQVDGTSEWSRCHSLVSGVATIGTCTLAVDWAQTL